MPTYTVILTLKVTTQQADAAKVKTKIADPKVLERMQNKVEYGTSQVEVVDVKVESEAKVEPEA